MLNPKRKPRRSPRGLCDLPVAAGLVLPATQPFEHCPSRGEVFLVVLENLCHQTIPLGFIIGLCRQYKLRHRPTAAILVLRSLETNVLLDYFEAVARQRQNNRVSRYRQQLEQVPEYAVCDSVGVAVPLDIHLNVDALVMVPMDRSEESRV